MRQTVYAKHLLVLLLLMTGPAVFAHTINYGLEQAPAGEVVWFYFKLGVMHIIPDGFDHILFVVGLCLLSPRWKAILWQATAFTVAHSITLVLSIKKIIVAPAGIIEPVIALSIMFVAVENILFGKLMPWRVAIVFFFGLVHGLGFASSLNEIGLPRNRFLAAITSFNIGVEAGQVIVIAAVFGLLLLPFGKRPWFKKYIVIPLSVMIAIVAGWWVIERV